MALPPKKISDHISISLSTPLVNEDAGLAALLSTYVTIDKLSDHYEKVGFIARKGDSLTLGGELFTVESIEQTDAPSTEEDIRNPDFRFGARVILASKSNPDNKITLTA